MVDQQHQSTAPREVHWGRLCLAVGIGLLCWWLGHWMPVEGGRSSPDFLAPRPDCRLLFVVGLTTSCWLLAAIPIAAASLLPLALLPLLGV